MSPAVLTLALLLVGLATLAAGLRRRCLDDRPRCGRCAFDLTGLSIAEGAACPECGRPLAPHAPKIGLRRRRPGLIWCGAAMLVLPLATLVTVGGPFAGAADRIKPDALLLYEARHTGAERLPAVLREIARRQAAGRISQASVQRLAESLASEFAPGFLIRERVHPGGPLVVRYSLGTPRLSELGYEFRHVRSEVAGMPWGGAGTFSAPSAGGAGGGFSDKLAFPLPLGPHTVRLEYDLVLECPPQGLLPGLTLRATTGRSTCRSALCRRTSRSCSHASIPEPPRAPNAVSCSRTSGSARRCPPAGAGAWSSGRGRNTCRLGATR